MVFGFSITGFCNTLSKGFPRQEYWSGLPFPSPGNRPNSGIEPASPALPGEFFTTGSSGKPNTGEKGDLFFLTITLVAGLKMEEHMNYVNQFLLKAIKLFQNEFSFSIT